MHVGLVADDPHRLRGFHAVQRDIRFVVGPMLITELRVRVARLGVDDQPIDPGVLDGNGSRRPARPAVLVRMHCIKPDGHEVVESAALDQHVVDAAGDRHRRVARSYPVYPDPNCPRNSVPAGSGLSLQVQQERVL